MNIRQRALAREVLAGTFLGLASSVTAEIAAHSGFDWLLIDTEHGMGENEALARQLQAISGSPAAPIVRIAANETPRFKRVLDLGAQGVMVPWVSSPDEARDAVAAVRFPPRGIRGAARLTRATGYGTHFDDYFAHAHERLLTVVQIEREEALGRLDEIAGIDGVDVLFVGPLDLSISLGIPQEFEHPRFREALREVAAAAAKAGKAAGILVMDADDVPVMVEAGYTFVALGSDTGLVSKGMQKLAAAFESVR